MARADIEAGVARRRAAPLGLPAHHRAEHGLLQQAAAAARRTTCAPTCRSTVEEIAGRARATSTTKPRRSRSPGRRCRHNLNYWEFGDYLGIGAGAHGKISFPDRVTRHERVKQPREYLCCKMTSLTEDECIAAGRAAVRVHAERAAPGRGIPDRRCSRERTGLPLTAIQAALTSGEQKGLIERDLKRIRPTERGQRFLNDLLGLFLPAQEQQVPHRVAEALPRRFELRHRPRSEPRRALLRAAAPSRSTVLHLLGVVRPVGGGVEDSRRARACAPRARRTAAAPGGACDGASSATGRERTGGCAASDAVGDHVLEHVDARRAGSRAGWPSCRASICFSRLPTPGPCTSTAMKSVSGCASAISRGGLAHAEADLQHQRRAAAESAARSSGVA